jgi:hypothetical protein
MISNILINRIISIAVFIVLVSFSIAVAQPAKKDVKVYRDKKYKFTLQYPSTWAVEPATHENTKFRLVSDNGSGPDDFIVNVQYIEAIKNTSTKEVVASLDPQVLVNGLRNTMPDIKLINSGKSHLSQLGAVFYVAEFTYRTFGVEAPMKMLQIQTFKNGYLYILGFRSPSERFNDMLPIFQNIAAGFIIQ